MNVERLCWPGDRDSLAQLTLDQKIHWYVTRDPREIIYLAQDKEFKRFWRIYYLWPLKMKRFLYKFKIW